MTIPFCPLYPVEPPALAFPPAPLLDPGFGCGLPGYEGAPPPVSYTHLTLPTKA